MNDFDMPVDGPFRLYLTATPTGISIDVSHYLTAVITGLAQAADEDPDGVRDELVDIAELVRAAGHSGSDSHAAHERDDRIARLLAEVAGEGVIPVYGAQVGALRDSLVRLSAPRPVPGQRVEGSAAA